MTSPGFAAGFPSLVLPFHSFSPIRPFYLLPHDRLVPNAVVATPAKMFRLLVQHSRRRPAFSRPSKGRGGEPHLRTALCPVGPLSGEKTFGEARPFALAITNPSTFAPITFHITHVDRLAHGGTLIATRCISAPPVTYRLVRLLARATSNRNTHARREPGLTRGTTSPSVLYE